MILKIAGRQFEYFSRFKVDMNYDAVASTFSFDFLFDRNFHSILHRFNEFSEVKVEHNRETIITGRIVTHKLISQPQKTLNTVAGYSLPGVLEDSTAPYSLYPLQVDGLSLKQLAQKLTAPFGLVIVIDASIEADMDIPYSEIKIGETQTLKSFLSELAALRGIVVSHTENGSLYFTKPTSSSGPVADFSDGGIPGLVMELDVNGQGLHEEVIALKDPDPELGASDESVIQLPYCNITKTMTQTSTAGDDIDISTTLRSAIARDLSNISLTMTFDRWDLKGKIIRPGNIITVRDPNLMMKNKVKWFVKNVRLEGDTKSFKSTITCCLPEVYTGEIPTYVFS